MEGAETSAMQYSIQILEALIRAADCFVSANVDEEQKALEAVLRIDNLNVVALHTLGQPSAHIQEKRR